MIHPRGIIRTAMDRVNKRRLYSVLGSSFASDIKMYFGIGPDDVAFTRKHHHYHHHQFLKREGRWGTTDNFATSFLHFSLFSTALWDLPNSRPVHSLMLSSHHVLCRKQCITNTNLVLNDTNFNQNPRIVNYTGNTYKSALTHTLTYQETYAVLHRQELISC